jgi:hypothetical protein
LPCGCAFSAKGGRADGLSAGSRRCRLGAPSGRVGCACSLRLQNVANSPINFACAPGNLAVGFGLAQSCNASTVEGSWREMLATLARDRYEYQLRSAHGRCRGLSFQHRVSDVTRGIRASGIPYRVAALSCLLYRAFSHIGTVLSKAKVSPARSWGPREKEIAPMRAFFADPFLSRRTAGNVLPSPTHPRAGDPTCGLRPYETAWGVRLRCLVGRLFGDGPHLSANGEVAFQDLVEFHGGE